MAVGGPVGGGGGDRTTEIENNFSQKLIAFSNNRSHPSGMHVCCSVTLSSHFLYAFTWSRTYFEASQCASLV